MNAFRPTVSAIGTLLFACTLVSSPCFANSAPSAVNDVASTHQGQSTVVLVTANDSAPDGDTVVVVDVPVASPAIDPADHGSWRKLSATFASPNRPCQESDERLRDCAIA